ncbi:hypothetical protein EVAR_79316_1 [Eumeta japonica]|uniref:Uncharacterized protein n=1 Tax=Eumeta variegata TaxID=151549 RepID=A0A4C1THD7_EUMVA|nr:hypothetical protein EVAR_79316_1 [Eumeta japonica]
MLTQCRSKVDVQGRRIERSFEEHRTGLTIKLTRRFIFAPGRRRSRGGYGGVRRGGGTPSRAGGAQPSRRSPATRQSRGERCPSGGRSVRRRSVVFPPFANCKFDVTTTSPRVR